MPDKPPRLISRCDFSVQHWVVPNDCLAFINWPPFHDFPVSVMWGVSPLITACSASSSCLPWLWLSFPWGSSAQLLVVVFLATPLDSGWSRSLCHWAARKQLLQSICCMPHRPPSHSLRLQNSSLGWSHVSSFVNQNGSNFSSEPSTNRFSKSHRILQVTFLFSVMPNSFSKLFYILTLISPLRVMIYVLEECCIFLWFSPSLWRRTIRSTSSGMWGLLITAFTIFTLLNWGRSVCSLMWSIYFLNHSLLDVYSLLICRQHWLLYLFSVSSIIWWMTEGVMSNTFIYDLSFLVSFISHGMLCSYVAAITAFSCLWVFSVVPFAKANYRFHCFLLECPTQHGLPCFHFISTWLVCRWPTFFHIVFFHVCLL